MQNSLTINASEYALQMYMSVLERVSVSNLGVLGVARNSLFYDPDEKI